MAATCHEADELERAAARALHPPARLLWRRLGGPCREHSRLDKLQEEAFLLCCDIEALEVEIADAQDALRKSVVSNDALDVSSANRSLESIYVGGSKPPETEAEEPSQGMEADIDVDQCRTGPWRSRAWQKLQKQLVARNVSSTRALAVLAGSSRSPEPMTRWSTPAQPSLYSSSDAAAQLLCCPRLLVEDVASWEECAALRGAATVAMRGVFHRGGQTTLGLSPALARRAPALHAGLSSLVERSRKLLQAHVVDASKRLSLAGAMLTRLRADGPQQRINFRNGAAALDGWEVDPGQVYWRPHIDRANVASYHVSALLYLSSTVTDASAHESSAGAPRFPADWSSSREEDEEREPLKKSLCVRPLEDFECEGGRLLLHDADVDRTLAPRVGRLVAFDSGLDNVHSVEPLRRGTRHVIAMWFSCVDAEMELQTAQNDIQATAATAAQCCSSALSSAGLVSAAEVSLPGNDPLREALLSSNSPATPAAVVAASEAVVVPTVRLPKNWATQPKCDDPASAPQGIMVETTEVTSWLQDLETRQEDLVRSLRQLRKSRCVALVALRPSSLVADESIADAFGLFDG